MALQYSTTHRTNAMADIATQAGASAVVKIFTGTPPASCATADTGTLIISLTGGATFGTAANGVLTVNTATLSGNATGAGTNTAGYFRVYPSAATTTNAVFQGTITGTGGGGDMVLTNTSIANGQQVTISSWTITAFGA